MGDTSDKEKERKLAADKKAADDLLRTMMGGRRATLKEDKGDKDKNKKEPEKEEPEEEEKEEEEEKISKEDLERRIAQQTLDLQNLNDSIKGAFRVSPETRTKIEKLEESLNKDQQHLQQFIGQENKLKDRERARAKADEVAKKMKGKGPEASREGLLEQIRGRKKLKGKTESAKPAAPAGGGLAGLHALLASNASTDEDEKKRAEEDEFEDKEDVSKTVTPPKSASTSATGTPITAGAGASKSTTTSSSTTGAPPKSTATSSPTGTSSGTSSKPTSTAPPTADPDKDRIIITGKSTLTPTSTPSSAPSGGTIMSDPKETAEQHFDGIVNFVKVGWYVQDLENALGPETAINVIRKLISRKHKLADLFKEADIQDLRFQENLKIVRDLYLGTATSDIMKDYRDNPDLRDIFYDQDSGSYQDFRGKAVSDDIRDAVTDTLLELQSRASQAAAAVTPPAAADDIKELQEQLAGLQTQAMDQLREQNSQWQTLYNDLQTKLATTEFDRDNAEQELNLAKANANPGANPAALEQQRLDHERTINEMRLAQEETNRRHAQEIDDLNRRHQHTQDDTERNLQQAQAANRDQQRQHDEVLHREQEESIRKQREIEQRLNAEVERATQQYQREHLAHQDTQKGMGEDLLHARQEANDARQGLAVSQAQHRDKDAALANAQTALQAAQAQAAAQAAAQAQALVQAQQAQTLAQQQAAALQAQVATLTQALTQAQAAAQAARPAAPVIARPAPPAPAAKPAAKPAPPPAPPTRTPAQQAAAIRRGYLPR